MYAYFEAVYQISKLDCESSNVHAFWQLTNLVLPICHNQILQLV